MRLSLSTIFVHLVQGWIFNCQFKIMSISIMNNIQKLILLKRIIFLILIIPVFSGSYAQTKTTSKSKSPTSEPKKTAPAIILNVGINGHIGDPKMTPEDMLAADSLMASYVLDGKICYAKILKYTASFGIKGQLYDFQNENARYNEKIKEVLGKIDKTCKVFFSDIKVMMPDGTIVAGSEFKVILSRE